MSQLTIYHENQPQKVIAQYDSENAIARELAKIGVRFERWIASAPLLDHANNKTIIAAYQSDINRLVTETGYQTYDVISMTCDHPQKNELRQKFLAEHTHDDDEIRFFTRGKGLFTLHVATKIYEVICQQNDLISIPAGTRHWFDMGANPDFTCIRLFDTPQGWVAKFTGSNIAEKFSCLAT
ncbi:MAG TPA: acireductone dioxygenase [Xenococcaceae cyanobacterium]